MKVKLLIILALSFCVSIPWTASAISIKPSITWDDTTDVIPAPVGVGFASMASAWIITTAFATIAICLHQVEQHREWMIRSYVVTFAFVTFRFLDGALETARIGTMVERMTAASWIAWTLPLLITESVLQARKMFAARAIAKQPQDANAYIAAPEPEAPASALRE